MMYFEKDFKNLRFNPMVNEKMLGKYPELLEIVSAEAAKDEHLDMLLRFIIMINDPKSIIFLSEKDVDRRKNVAAELCGFPDNSDFIDAVFTYNYPTVLDLTMKYLIRFVKNKEFAALITLEQCFWEEIRVLNMPIMVSSVDKDDLAAFEKKGKVKAELDLDINRIDAYYKKFLGDDPELQKKRERMTPENIRKLKSE